jgi:hypothetical protein
VAFYSAGSDDLGDLLTRAIFLRQAGITIRYHSYFPSLTQPALSCMRQPVWPREKVTIEAEKFVRSDQADYLQLKWNGSALGEYSILQERIIQYVPVDLTNIVDSPLPLRPFGAKEHLRPILGTLATMTLKWHAKPTIG